MFDFNEAIRECVREEIRRMIPEVTQREADDDFIDTVEAARITGLSKQFFECGRSNKDPNQPRHYKVGRRVLYSRAELTEWLRHRREA